MTRKYQHTQARYIHFMLVLLLALFLLLPSTMHAYFTTNQNAVRISPTSAIYTVSYKFGSEKEDMYMPIAAIRNLAHGSQTKSLGYELIEEGDAATTTGTATGLVLSSAEIVDGMYKIPKGFAASFTLFVIYTVPEVHHPTEYALLVTELPYYLGDDREAQSMNPSELQYYLTPEVELNNQ